MKSIRLKTKDGVKIEANYYNKGRKNAIIIAPGWCMTKDSNAFKRIAESFSKNFDVLSIDFRGHGKSGGFYTFSAKEFLDIEASVDFLREKEGQYENVFLAGFSLGAASALIYGGISKERGLKTVDKIIAVSPPSNFSKIENQMWKKEAWNETFKKTFGKANGDTEKKWEITRFLSIRPSIFLHKKIKPEDIVDKIEAPTLFIAGKKDPTVHFWHTVKLYEKAKCKKALKLFDEGIHSEDIFLYFEEEFMMECTSWLK